MEQGIRLDLLLTKTSTVTAPRSDRGAHRIMLRSKSKVTFT
jgi:hypothetical protein